MPKLKKLSKTAKFPAAACTSLKKQIPQPITQRQIPERPWAQVASDIFKFHQEHYVELVDNYSKWISVEKLDDLTIKSHQSNDEYPHHTWIS